MAEFDYYFDINKHRELIPERGGISREHPTKTDANKAEEELWDRYIYRDNYYGRTMYLRVWEEDSLDESPTEEEAGFLRSWRRAVAEQIWWNELKRRANPLYESHSVGNESVDYNTDKLEKKWAPKVDTLLQEYDARPNHGPR